MMIDINGFRFRCRPDNRKKTYKLIVKTIANNIDKHRLHDLHLGRGFLGVNYHYLLDNKGLIHSLRPVECKMDETMNDAITICINNELNVTQRYNIRNLILDIVSKYPRIQQMKIVKSTSKGCDVL